MPFPTLVRPSLIVIISSFSEISAMHSENSTQRFCKAKTVSNSREKSQILRPARVLMKKVTVFADKEMSLPVQN